MPSPISRDPLWVLLLYLPLKVEFLKDPFSQYAPSFRANQDSHGHHLHLSLFPIGLQLQLKSDDYTQLPVIQLKMLYATPVEHLSMGHNILFFKGKAEKTHKKMKSMLYLD